MTLKELKKKKGELGTILNTFDVEKLTEYMKTTDLFKASYKDNFLKSGEERRTMFMCFMIIDPKAPANVYPVTKRKAKELISKKFTEELFEAAKKKVDAREERKMIILISSILAFATGFVFSILYLTYCSEEKWQNFKKSVERARRK